MFTAGRVFAPFIPTLKKSDCVDKYPFYAYQYEIWVN